MRVTHIGSRSKTVPSAVETPREQINRLMINGLKADRFRKRSKYKAVRTIVDGHNFHSKAEARRYGELRLLEKAGKIRQLELQPRYPLVVNGEDCGTYIGDFRYFDLRGSRPEIVLENVKGCVTALYKFKKQIVEALYPGLKIAEVRT